MKTTTDIIGELARLLADFQGREYSNPITAETLFFGDLGFASIDAVVLGEKLRELYGSSIPFNQFLAAAAQRKAQDIRVGELASFLAGHVGATP
jgi:acyl carrier protein